MRDVAGQTTRGRLRGQQVHIGAVWVSLMEPEVGQDVAFHQWYADDHFYAGGMSLPWIFAGRRWVCPRAHQALRSAQDDSPFQARHEGRFLHLNLFSRGHVDAAAGVLGETIASLAGEGRMYVDDIPRRHVFSRLQPYVGVVYRAPDENGPLDIHALDYPFRGVVVEVVRAVQGQSRQGLVEWLLDEFVPAQLEVTHAEMCLVCLDADLPDAVATKTARVPSAYGQAADQRVTLLWFVEQDPQERWHERFAAHPDALADAGLGVLEFSSPFVPTVPGTDRHIDDLR